MSPITTEQNIDVIPMELELPPIKPGSDWAWAFWITDDNDVPEDTTDWFVAMFGRADNANGPIVFRIATSFTMSGTTASGTKVITGLSSTANMWVGMSVSGTGIGSGAKIASIDSATQITVDVNSTASATNTLTFSTPGTVTNTPAEGKFSILLPSTETDDIAVKKIVWDVRLKDETGGITFPFQGIAVPIHVEETVTK